MVLILFYSGQLVGFFGNSLIGNMVRPKIIMVGSLLFAVLGALIVCFSDILELTVFGMWCMMFGLTGPFNLSFIFIT